MRSSRTGRIRHWIIGLSASIKTGQVPSQLDGVSGSVSVVKVKLEGLNVYRSRGKWYVYVRATGEALIKGFDGDRADLERKLPSPEFIASYNRPRSRTRPVNTFAVEYSRRFHQLVYHWRH
jgi:hypothetical protein